MELSIDEKIQAAIEPLIARIVSLQTSNQKFKAQLAALQTSNQVKPPQKQPVKVVAETVDRPQTVKGGRKKQEEKANPKKEEGKDEHEQPKVENPKVNSGKTPAVVSKPAPPVIHKQPNTKDPKAKVPGVAGQGGNTKDLLGNKSGVHQKKPYGVKTSQNQHEKKEEGAQKNEEKKGNLSQQKPDPKDQKGGKVSLPINAKIPAPTKTKPADKPVIQKNPVGTANANKKGGKVVMGGAPKDVKVEEVKPAESIEKEEPLLIGSEDNKEEVKKEENKEEAKKEDTKEEVKNEDVKEEEVSEAKKEEQIPPVAAQQEVHPEPVQTHVDAPQS